MIFHKHNLYTRFPCKVILSVRPLASGPCGLCMWFWRPHGSTPWSALPGISLPSRPQPLCVCMCVWGGPALSWLNDLAAEMLLFWWALINLTATERALPSLPGWDLKAISVIGLTHKAPAALMFHKRGFESLQLCSVVDQSFSSIKKIITFISMIW